MSDKDAKHSGTEKSSDETMKEAEEFLKRAAESPSSGLPYDILIVDDVHANVYLMESILSGKFTYRGSENVTDMWRRLKSDKMKLILLDLMMPFENGFEILDKLRTNDLYKHIPVIVVTARDSREDVMKAMSLGAKDYIVKPVKEDVLLMKIEKLIGESA